MEINYYRNPNSQGYDQSWQSFPHETCMPSMAPHTGIDDDTLRDIVDAVIQPGITTSELLAQVRERHSQLKRSTRDAALLDQIRRLNLLDPHPDATTVDLVSTAASASNPVDDCAAVAQRHSQDQEINTELTLPPHQHNTNLAHEGDLKPLSGFAPWREARGVRMPQNNQIIPGHLQYRVS